MQSLIEQMNLRHKEIGSFFNFLQENSINNEMFEKVFEKVECEIKEEQKVNSNIKTNDYLNGLLQNHSSSLHLFEKSKGHKPQKISYEAFRHFMVISCKM